MSGRAQANLLALGAALVLVVAAAGLSLSVAAGAFATAERAPAERAVAIAVADHLVDADGPVARTPGALDDRALSDLDAASLEAAVPDLAGRAVRVSVGDRLVVSRGDPVGGTTVRRLVLTETVTSTNRTVSLEAPETVVEFDRRTARLDVNLSGTGGGVTAVTVGGQTVLENRSGLNGSYTVRPGRAAPPTVTLLAANASAGRTVAFTTYPWTTTPTRLEVTVGA